MNKKLIDNKARIVYKMLGFQYRPLEKRILNELSPERKTQYIKMSYVKKIIILDAYAGHLGL